MRTTLQQVQAIHGCNHSTEASMFDDLLGAAMWMQQQLIASGALREAPPANSAAPLQLSDHRRRELLSSSPLGIAALEQDGHDAGKAYQERELKRLDALR